ncbi:MULTISPECIES: nuclear transport factor 2 family protein [Streptomyces]|jgi:Mce-associated membrane protein|uniref:Nuclear transport factor 2 family protein n=1 Tax=Streptomyces edwardsiae TaxID=3075527 RepID=A0ABU2PSA0_9ACTN|nr:nuclear transport factor 2 family protein [Streptomyces sp. DSM 41636]MDT0393884.1 nuclear transport factor 2 family protein [Streptomyces sp. DSM 41636]
MKRAVRALAGTRPLPALALALTLVAGGFAVRAGQDWYDAAHDDRAAYAGQRDAALAAGEQAVQNLNTLDHRDVNRGLDLWESSTTGELHEQLTTGRTEFAEQVKAAKTVTTARVLSGAVTELDDRAGRARVLVALRVTVKADDGAKTDKDSRMLGELTRTDGRWKLSALGQAPVGGTSDG